LRLEFPRLSPAPPLDDAHEQHAQRDAYDEHGKAKYGIHLHYGPIVLANAKGFTPDEPIPATLWSTVADHALQERIRVHSAQYRRDAVVNQMVALAMQGDLAFAARRKGGGSPMLPVDRGMWDLDYPWIPFATLGFDQERGLASVAATHWLFVTGDSLGKVLGLPAKPDSPPGEQVEASMAAGTAPQKQTAPLSSKSLMRPAGDAWLRREPPRDVIQMFHFFSVATAFMPGGDRALAQVALHKTYKEWLAKQHPHAKPIERTAFLKWLGRFQSGYRIDKRAWVLSH